MAHKWARWLHNPCHLGGPHRFIAGGRIRSGTQVGNVAAKPLPLGGSPQLQSGGAESEVAHKWARWLHNPCHLGGPHRFIAGGRIRGGTQVGNVAAKPLPLGGSPQLQSGEQNQKLPTSGQRSFITPAAQKFPPPQSGGQNQRRPRSGPGGYITPATWGVPTAS